MFNVSFDEKCVEKELWPIYALNALYSNVFSDKAKVIYAPTEIYLPYGRPATLDCHFRSNPPLTNLRWEKDGFLFDPYNVQVCIISFYSCHIAPLSQGALAI